MAVVSAGGRAYLYWRPVPPLYPVSLFGDAAGGAVRSNGTRLTLPGVSKDLEPPLLSVVAMTYYPDSGQLACVRKDASVSLYSPGSSSGRLNEVAGRKAPKPARFVAARFTRLPGLIYLEWVDEKLGTPYRCGQERGYECERVALTSEASTWDAISVEHPEEGLLQGLFRNVGRSLRVSLRPGHEMTVALPEALAKPYDPGDLEQGPVYALPDGRLVCKTVSGWSVHDATGACLGAFSGPGTNDTCWLPPRLNGAGIVVSRGGLGDDAKAYLLDIETGKMVCQ